MSLQRTSKNNPCPICEDAKGNCRIGEEIILCRTHVDAPKGEIINGYACVKPVTTGHTATFKVDNSQEWSDERKQEWEAQKHIRRQVREQQAKADLASRQEKALSASERHELYSDILDQLTLDAPTVTNLRRRGFSDEEITQSGFKSVEKFQRLNKIFDTRLPGINKDGSSLANFADGYLCPIRDFEGLITGLQLRLHNPEDGGRYRWLSTPERASLKLQPEDEIPLAVFHPDGEVKGIAIVEGTGAKPFFVSQRLDLLTIGAAGGQWLGSEKLLEKYINQAIAKYGNLPINLIPDAGWALNRQVKQNFINTAKWLKSKFPEAEVRVLDWNQLHKSQGDIDELQDISIVRFLSLDSFLKKYQAVIDFDKGFGNKQYQNWADSRAKLTVDVTQNERWFSIPSGIENECDILLVRARLGAGKTQGLIEYLKTQYTTSLLVGYRNTLLYNTIDRANNLGLNAQHIKGMSEVIEGYNVNFAADESIKLWGGCADSFNKFNAIINNNPKYNLIHDEIVSVLGHLKGGGTLKGRQQQAIQWDVNTINNSQFAIMMDANLSDKHVDFIRELFPNKRIKVLDSVYAVQPRKFIFVETQSNKSDFSRNANYLPSHLIEKAKLFNKVLWISDSQRSCEVADEILTKHGHKHFRLDGKTSDTELAKLFQSAPKAFITSENLDSVSLSPSAESGLSIDLYDYFDAVCFDIRGTVGVDTLTQMSARLRDTNVPIYVACPEFVNMTSDICPYPIAQVKEVFTQRLDMVLAKSMEVDEELVNSDFVADMFKEMAAKFASDPWFIEALKDSKQLKYEHSNLKTCLKTALTQAGHRVIDLVERGNEDEKDEIETTKEEVKFREAEKVFRSEDITWEEAQKLLKKDIGYGDKCKVRKAKLKHSLPGIEKTASWNADFIYSFDVDNPKFIESRWRLKQLQDEELFNAVFKLGKKFNFENGFAPQDIWKSASTKIEALKLLGVGRIIEAGVFSPQDDWVQQIVNEYYDNSSWFEIIGISKVKRREGTLHHIKGMVDRFLDYFGLASKQSHRDNTGQRWYEIQVPEELVSWFPSSYIDNKQTTTPINQNQPEGVNLNEPTRSDSEIALSCLPSSYIDNKQTTTGNVENQPEGINPDWDKSDIDLALDVRAQIAIADAQEISFAEIASKAERQARIDREWEEKHQAELNQRMLENSLTRNDSEKLVSWFPSSYIDNSETTTPINQNQPEGINPEWVQVETINHVASVLADCESFDALSELRGCNIPSHVFKIASRLLPVEKYEQIREWVLQDNQELKPAIEGF